MTLCYLLLGSYSREQQTPYSDLESCIIVDDRVTSGRYAKELAKLLLLNIINLGETVLPNLDITIRHAGQTIGLTGKIFDDYTLQGLSDDRGKITPLSGKFQLITTPYKLVNQLADREGANQYIFLPQILRSNRLLFGNAALYALFLDLIRHSRFNLASYAEMMLRKDINDSLKEMKAKTVTKKHAYYRPVTTFIENLSMHLHLTCNAFEKIEKLYESRILSLHERDVLEKTLTWMQYLRLQQHFKFNEQKTEIAVTDRFYCVVKQIQENMVYLYDMFLDRLARYENNRLRQEKYLSGVGFFSHKTKYISPLSRRPEKCSGNWR